VRVDSGSKGQKGSISGNALFPVSVNSPSPDLWLGLRKGCLVHVVSAHFL